MFEFGEPRGLSEEYLMLREQVRRVVEAEIAPHGDQWERDGRVPRELFVKLGSLGLLGMRHPSGFGGSDLGPIASVILAEELSRGSYGGVATAITVHSDMSMAHIAHRGSDEQKRRYLPAVCAGEKIGCICITEPGAGSDVAGLKTKAVRDGDDWIISGGKACRCSSSSPTRRASTSSRNSTSMAGARRTRPS
jgi:acyl-CoA dehydrogenase